MQVLLFEIRIKFAKAINYYYDADKNENSDWNQNYQHMAPERKAT